MNAAPDFSTLLSTLGQNGLTQLLGAFNQSKPAQQPAAAATPDLTQLLQSITASQQQSAAYGQGAQTQLQTQPQTTGQTLQNLLQNPALASLLGGQAPAQPPSASAQPPASGQPAAQPDMNEIMAQLAKYQR
jgi:sulfite reductase alpha subunit-like flavoprotein